MFCECVSRSAKAYCRGYSGEFVLHEPCIAGYFMYFDPMKQLFFVRKEKLEWRETSPPRINSDAGALVRPFAVAKCDLDDAFLFHDLSFNLAAGKWLGMIDPSFFRLFGVNFFKGPFPFGHECVAEVIETGPRVKDVKIGDVVSVPFQISCGNCKHCTNGLTGHCEKTPELSTYGFGKHLQFGGAMSDVLYVPYADAMLLKIPVHINPVHLASLSDNVPDAYKNVGPLLEKNSNQTVLIIGGKAKSVGLYSLLIAKALGAPRVDYVDRDPDRLMLAMNLGADHVMESYEKIRDQYDITVDASSHQKGLFEAIKSLKTNGTCSSSGIFIKKTRAPFLDMYGKGVTFKMGLANARTDAEKVLELVEKDKLPLQLVTTKLDTWENSIEAFLTKTSKVIVTREKILK